MFYVSIKTFCRKWEGETLPKWFFFLSNLKNAKPDNLNLMSYCRRTSLARSKVPRFSTKKESVIILQMPNLWRENLAIFHDVRKYRFVFLTKVGTLLHNSAYNSNCS